MTQNILRRFTNRALHLLARTVPGSTTVRPMLHRLRGVKIGNNVFIGDDVYLENEHPSAIEIHSGAQISVRAVLLAHTRGAGKLIIEKDAFIGPNCVIATTGNRTIRIGEGAVIGAGVVVTRSVPPRVFLAQEPAKPIADVRVPLPKANKMEDFVHGLVPIKAKTF